MTHCIRGVPGPGAGSPWPPLFFYPSQRQRQRETEWYQGTCSRHLGRIRPLADSFWDDSSRALPQVRNWPYATQVRRPHGTGLEGTIAATNRRLTTWPSRFSMYIQYVPATYLLTKVLRRWSASLPCWMDGIDLYYYHARDKLPKAFRGLVWFVWSELNNSHITVRGEGPR